MKNISGSGKNWMPESEETTTKMVVKRKRKVTVKLTSEIKKLEIINSSIEKKYEQSSDKNLYDAMLSLEMAILSLKNLN